VRLEKTGVALGIEAQARRVPEQYLWIHRRFKGLSADYPNYYAATK